MTRESMIKVLRYKAEHIKAKITPKFFLEVADTLEQEPCEDAISRTDAINKVTNFYTNCERLKMFQHTSNEVKQTVADILSDLPLVQPKYNANEWCHDCSEYDRDKHCCPRYNNVIRNAVEKIKESKTGHWIKITPSGIYMCSECEQNVLTGDIDVYHYCHQCGARMESED